MLSQDIIGNNYFIFFTLPFLTKTKAPNIPYQRILFVKRIDLLFIYKKKFNFDVVNFWKQDNRNINFFFHPTKLTETPAPFKSSTLGLLLMRKIN